MKSSSLTRFSIRPIVAASLLGFCLAAPLAQAQITFFNPPTFVGGTDFVADFNGDGKPDLLGSNGGLLLGNGDGTFAAATYVAGGSTVLAVADFNGDGKPDLLTQSTGALQVLLGKGDGTFEPPIGTNTGAGILFSVAAADLNGDGKLDVVGVLDNGKLAVFLGKGDGTFAPGVSYFVASNAGGGTTLTLGDFNGDLKTDVALSIPGSNGPGSEVVLLGNGDGTFKPGKTSIGAQSLFTFSVVAGDFNNDGKLDLVVADGSHVFVLLGNGDGTFQSPTTASSSGGTLATADLNGDGKLDLVVASSSASLIEIDFGNGDGTFTNAYSYESYNFGSGPVIADFNLDGKPDIASGGVVLLGNGNGSFRGLVAATGGVPAVAGDFDKNSTQDIATSFCVSGNPNCAGNPLSILLNDGSGALRLAHTYTLQQTALAIAEADLNGDGNLDLIVAGVDPLNGDWSYSVLLGNGDGSFQSPVFYPQSSSGPGQPSIVVADFNNDHKLDLAITAIGNQSLAVLLGNGDGTFAAPAYFFNAGGTSVVAADFNGDGNADLASDGGGAGLAILLGNGDGTFQPASLPPTNLFSLCCTADLNGDGKADLVGTGQAGGQVQVLLGKGDGTFTALSPFGSGNDQYVIINATADINHDGIPDLVALQFVPGGDGQSAVTAGVYPGNGDGTFGSFVAAYAFGTSEQLTGILELAADMNGDGKPDLILGAQSMFVVPNTTQPGFTIEPASGQSSSAAISAGNSAMFNLAVQSSESFSGTVNLSCVTSPSVTPAPTCSFSANSVSVTPGKPVGVQLTVATASTSSGTLSDTGLPTGAVPLTWSVVLFGSALVLLRNRRRLGVPASSVAVLSAILFVGCGGSSSSSSHTTPPGKYTVTVNGTSGSLQSSTALTLFVH